MCVYLSSVALTFKSVGVHMFSKLASFTWVQHLSPVTIILFFIKMDSFGCAMTIVCLYVFQL